MTDNENTQSSLGFQGGLFGSSAALKSKVIFRRRDFDGLFEGFNKMRGISFVASPNLLLNFMDKQGYTSIEIIVGEDLSATYKNELEQEGISVIDRLIELQKTGNLSIYIPKHTIHTKMYILEGPSSIRIIQTSANLTDTAREASSQTNYAWYLDLPLGSPAIEQYQKDYESHRNICTLFLEDLNQLINTHFDMDKRQVIEAWIKGIGSEEEDTSGKQAFNEISTNLLTITDTNQQQESVVVLNLPEGPRVRKQIEKLLAPINPVVHQEKIRINRTAYVDYVYGTYHIPLLVPHMDNKQLILGLDGEIVNLVEKPPSPENVNNGLQHIEDYINTVDFGKSADPFVVKVSMYEALLFTFFSPFAHEYMKIKRAKMGLIDNRGPRFLYVYGPSQNGKTTFLRFVLKLITGKNIEALSRQDFTRSKIHNISSIGTVFPLTFDDVDPSTNIKGLEDVFKSYWERWWRQQYITPQIIITSNNSRLPEWAKSRVKRIDFDVHFASDDTESKTKLNNIFSEDNHIFRWFSYYYFQHPSVDITIDSDELKLTRDIMKDLYHYANRTLPEYFPKEAIEKIYDPGRYNWRDAIFSLNKAKLEHKDSRVVVTFTPDMQYWQISNYLADLPQIVKHKRTGNTIIIENPLEFEKWLGNKPQTGFSFSRIFRGH